MGGKFFVKTLDKLRGVDWKSICLGHYGMYYGPDVNIVSGKSNMLQRWDESERQVYIYNITTYYRDAGPGRPKAPAEVEASTGRDTSKPHR